MELDLIKMGYSLYFYILDQIKRLSEEDKNKVLKIMTVLLFSEWFDNSCDSV